MSTASPWGAAGACVQRCDHGADTPLTLAEAVEQVRHPLTGLTREQLVEVVAHLACQVVGRSHDIDADAVLAMTQIRRIVGDYETRHAAGNEVGRNA